MEKSLNFSNFFKSRAAVFLSRKRENPLSQNPVWSYDALKMQRCFPKVVPLLTCYTGLYFSFLGHTLLLISPKLVLNTIPYIAIVFSEIMHARSVLIRAERSGGCESETGHRGTECKCSPTFSKWKRWSSLQCNCSLFLD
jgi:hypothetical protein